MLLRDDMQAAMNQVSVLCVEAADHYASAVAKTDEPDLARLFDTFATRHTEFAGELAAHIRAMDDLPQAPDPDREAVSEVLNSIKAFFSDDTHATLVDDCIHFEEQLASAVNEALQQPVPAATQDLLQRLLSFTRDAQAQLAAVR